MKTPIIKPDYVTLLETEYVAKILGFAYQKLNDHNEAEDLASDITLEVLKTIRSGRDIYLFPVREIRVLIISR